KSPEAKIRYQSKERRKRRRREGRLRSSKPERKALKHERKEIRKRREKGKKEDRIRVRGRGARREERMLGGVAKQEKGSKR
ncbi:hypothetical protein, partial [Campylobacter jejuni]|uniref:hypothetical protein n=1 Tax=Campylobacter jejuni TaxID=197 RepID=UPI001E5FFD9D